MSRAALCLVALLLTPAVARSQIFVPSPGGVTSGVVGGIVAEPGQGPARDNTQPEKTGTSRIRGRVIAADTGQPLRRATIRLSSPDLRQGRGTSTDGEGRYEFKDLPASRYTLTAAKNGYVSTSYGARRPNEQGRPLDLGDKQIADRVDFSLPRGGVITGRIVDEFGEPVIGAMVQPMRSTTVNGQRREVPAGQQATTPDTGEFRLWGLPAGEYLVMVTAQSRGMGFMETTDDRTGYPPTYYPGTANPSEAQPVTVAIGQTASGIDITLMPTRTATITGTTIDSKGQPLRRGNVMLSPRTGVFMGMMSGGMIRPDGTFTISNVAPGEYTVRATTSMSGPGVPPEVLIANITVTGEDITGLVLTPMRAVKITGRIVLDPPGKWVDPASIRVQAMPKTAEPMSMVGIGPPIMRDDFTFEVSSPPGAVNIRAFPMALPTTAWSVKAVRHDGQDVIDSGLELGDGRDVDDVEIVLTNVQQTVSGLVTNARGEPAGDATAMFFSQNPDQWVAASRFVGVARPDQNGRYSIRNLPPGEYYGVAVQSIDPVRRSADPRSYYEDLSRIAVRLSLREAETRTLDLKLVERP
jgi:hypothetical protein